MRFKIQLCIGFLFFLFFTACGGETVDFKAKTFIDPNFTIDYPEDWLVKTRQDFSNQIPRETVVIFNAPQPRNGYQGTLSVINDLVPQGVTSLEYAQSNINNAIQNVLEFNIIEERKVLLGKEETKLLIFKGKSSLDSKQLRYIQTYLTFGDLGYTITASDLLDTDEAILKNLEAMVLSFRLKTEN